MTNDFTIDNDDRPEPVSGTFDAPDGVGHHTYDQPLSTLQSIDDGDDLWVTLLTDNYRPDLQGHDTVSEVWHHEPMDSPDYTGAGKPIKNVTVRQNYRGVTQVRGDDVTWDVGDELTARYAAVYKPIDGDLLTLLDFGQRVQATGPDGAFNIEWDNGRIFNYNPDLL